MSLDADFLGGIAHPSFLPLAAAYAERHRYEEGKEPNRLYVVESMPTVTGFKAEHRLALKPSEIARFAQALADGSTLQGAAADQQKFFAALAADLRKSGGKCVVIPGEQASPAVHAAAYALNASLGAVGKTVVYTGRLNPLPSGQGADLKALVADMNAGKVKWLVVLGVNPVYSAPADLGFKDAFNKVPVTAHLGSHVDETGAISTWHINKSHFLESWSDARAYDGTITIIQPMIDPLYAGKSAHDVFQTLLANPQASAYDAVAANARSLCEGRFCCRMAHELCMTAGLRERRLRLRREVRRRLDRSRLRRHRRVAWRFSFRPDPSLYDGRFANVGWLQELPKQVTNLSWDNAALMGLETMGQLKLEETGTAEIELNGRKVVAPVLMVPGHPEGVVTVHLGFGRGVEAGRVGAGVGFNAYGIRATDGLLSAGGAKLTKASGEYDLCVTKVHNIEHRGSFAQYDLNKPLSDKEGTFSLAGHEAMERAIIRYATLEEAKKNPDFAHEGASGALASRPKLDMPRWGDAEEGRELLPERVGLQED